MHVAEQAVAPWSIQAERFPASGDVADKLSFLLGYAVLAPSGHNTQPWRFVVEGDAVALCADRTQRLPVVDPEDRALVISCGAALLNLRVALRCFGYRDDCCELLPATRQQDVLACVRLVEGSTPSADDSPLLAAITQRRTTRAAYEARDVPADVRRLLEGEATREGAWLHVVRPAEREAVTALIAQGDREQMADKLFRRELAAWLHPNTSSQRRGMRGSGFGFGDLMSLAGPIAIRTFDLGRGQAAKDRELAEHSPLLAVLGTDGDSRCDWLRAGQAMERVLLRACAHGLTASFLNQPVEVAALRPRLADAIARGDGSPQLVMRFGYGPDVPHMPREAVDAVLERRRSRVRHVPAAEPTTRPGAHARRRTYS
jgi:hypothetical protein